MLPKIRVAVKDDKIVLRDPKNMKRVTTAGIEVPRNAFWIRRLKAGDVIQMNEPIKAPSKAANDKE